jgi:hypothetical protein
MRSPPGIKHWYVGDGRAPPGARFAEPVLRASSEGSAGRKALRGPVPSKPRRRLAGRQRVKPKDGWGGGASKARPRTGGECGRGGNVLGLFRRRTAHVPRWTSFDPQRTSSAWERRLPTRERTEAGASPRFSPGDGPARRCPAGREGRSLEGAPAPNRRLSAGIGASRTAPAQAAAGASKAAQ